MTYANEADYFNIHLPIKVTKEQIFIELNYEIFLKPEFQSAIKLLAFLYNERISSFARWAHIRLWSKMLVLLFVVIKSNPTCKITETNEVRVNVILLKVHKIHLKGASAKILKKYS